MSDAFKIANDASKMVEQGMTMNNKVAAAKGAIEKFAPGNQVINDGRRTMSQGIQLIHERRDHGFK